MNLCFTSLPYFQTLKFLKMTIFTRIINGEIPAYRIAEDDFFLAFLDINPLREGHTLVIPKTETDHFFDLDENYLSRILVFAKPIAKAIEKSFYCNRCGISVVGLEVPHAHIHLIPINRVSDMDFKKPKLKLSPEQFRNVQEKLISNLNENFSVKSLIIAHFRIAISDYTVILSTLNWSFPAGTITSATSPTCFPSRPFPMGEETEILPSLRSASFSETR